MSEESLVRVLVKQPFVDMLLKYIFTSNDFPLHLLRALMV